MSGPSPCPPAEVLRQLLVDSAPGEADPAERARLIAHLDSCVNCQRRLEKLADAPPTILDAAGALRHSGFTEEPSLRRVLERLEGDRDLTVLSRPDSRPSWVRTLLRPADAEHFLGQLDDYEVLEVLGHGGMGLVLKAYEPALKRWVAVKVLAPDLASDSVGRERFSREAQAAAGLHHPNVITIHGVRETNGVPYLVMEYAPGGSLQDYLDAHGPPDWRISARLAAEIAEGLAAAHERGLIHRDIKPSNILLQKSGASAGPGLAKIGDFGLARLADESRLTQTGIVAGTPMYMAPEQALCEPLDERADLFSLGSVLYTLLTGKEPFPAGSPVAVLRQVCEARPQPVREINPAVPPWLAATVERLHAKKPADRFASAAEVADLLRYNLAHPDNPRQVELPGEAKEARRRLWRILAAAALLGILLVGGLALTEGLGLTHLVRHAAAGNGLPLKAELRGHRGPVWSVAFAPSGKILATGGDDNTLRFWDAATGAQVVALTTHSAVSAVVFAHSGKFLISGESDGSVRQWDVANQAEGPPLPHKSASGRRLALSPDDKLLAVTTTDQGVELWDLGSRSLRKLAGRHGSVLGLAFSPDGKTLATGDASGGIRLWDPDSGKELAHFRGDPLGVRALAYSTDGAILASAGTGDKDVKLWDASTHQLLTTLSYTPPAPADGVQALCFAPARPLLAGAGRDGSVTIWEVPSGRILATLHAHQGRVWGAAISPDGLTLATVGEDRLGKLWDLSPLLP